MKPIVYIFFNGEGVEFPRNNDWEKFREIDAVRTFLICSDSWERNGWEVRRISTMGNIFNYQKTPFDGRCVQQMNWYPSEYWQFVAKAKSLLNPGEWGMFVTMDVINAGFIPEMANPHIVQPGIKCISFQVEHFSMSTIYCSWEWLEKAEQVLLDYDSGKLPEIRGNYVSDERILREYLPGLTVPLQKFACNPGFYPLIHFARSTLARKYAEIPTP